MLQLEKVIHVQFKTIILIMADIGCFFALAYVILGLTCFSCGKHLRNSFLADQIIEEDPRSGEK